MKEFLIQSEVKFAEENIFALENPTHEEVRREMDKVSYLATTRTKGKTGKATNVFCYYSGHGASLDGKLNIVVPNATVDDDLEKITEISNKVSREVFLNSNIQHI